MFIAQPTGVGFRLPCANNPGCELDTSSGLVRRRAGNGGQQAEDARRPRASSLRIRSARSGSQQQGCGEADAS